MNICVCGWYGKEFDDFYMTLYRARKKHNIMVMAKREDKFWEQMDLPYMVIENIGLEWAAYNYYLENIWEEGDVFFTHDDISILPIIQNNETVKSEILFDKFAEIDYDQAYIFTSRADDVYNMGSHGRSLFVSHGIMEWLKPRGIWFDSNNYGYTGGKKPRGMVKHYNTGTEAFRDQMKVAKQEGYNVLNKVYAPAYCMAHRGKIKKWEELL